MVWWLDPTAMNDEIDNTTIIYPAVAHTYGELIYEDEHMINVLPESFPVDESGRHKTCIPKKHIVKMWSLNISKCLIDQINQHEHFLKAIGGNY